MDHRLTSVLPFCILCKSLWAWAQKSRQAVTPENGRPSFKPRRHSGALCSYSIWKEMTGITATELDAPVHRISTECSTVTTCKPPNILEVATYRSWRQIKSSNLMAISYPYFVPCCFVPCYFLSLAWLWNWPIILFLAYYFWFSASGWCFYVTNAVHGFNIWHCKSDMFV